jgi:hypothetical protein
MLVLVCLEIVLILTPDRCMVCAESTIGSEIILDAPNGVGDEAQVDAHFGRLEIVLILTSDICTVCVERTIGLEIGLDAPRGSLR